MAEERALRAQREAEWVSKQIFSSQYYYALDIY